MSRKHLLKDSALERLGTLLAAVQNAEAADTEWRARANIHFLRNYTTEPLDPYITFHLMRDDLLPEITHGGYGTMVQELLDPKSPIASNPPDMLMLSQLVEFLDPAAVDSGWRADAARTLAERAHAMGWFVSLLPAPDGRDWNDIRCHSG